MVFIIIGTVEYARIITRLCNNRSFAEEKVTYHKNQLQKYMDAKERLNDSRKRNGQAHNDKIDFHLSKMMFYQEKTDHHETDLRIFQNSFLHDGIPGTQQELNSRIGTTLQARIDFEIQTGRRRVKEEPEETDIKQEPIDENNEDVKREIALPNVIKSEAN